MMCLVLAGGQSRAASRVSAGTPSCVVLGVSSFYSSCESGLRGGLACRNYATSDVFLIMTPGVDHKRRSNRLDDDSGQGGEVQIGQGGLVRALAAFCKVKPSA